MRHLLVFLLLLLPTTLPATSIFDEISNTTAATPLEISLTLPVDSLHVRRPNPQKASFSYVDAGGKTMNWRVKISPRGKFRRHNCDHPPLKLDFDKDDLCAVGLADYDKYKLVTTCFHGTASDRLIKKEYLAYQAYQLFTPTSFRVRLLTITYRDANNQHADRKATAFLIENSRELADRQGVERVENPIGLPAKDYDPTAEATHALFQYLIGNTDWSNTLALNMKTLKHPDGSLLPVGYDFDFSGWVNTSYSRPRHQLGQRFIGQRVYLGFHQHDDVLTATADKFLAQKDALRKLIDEAPIARADRRYLLKYTKAFFSELEDLRAHDMMMLYQDLRGEEKGLIPAGAMPSDFAVMRP